jgi:hypothetical protein
VVRALLFLYFKITGKINNGLKGMLFENQSIAILKGREETVNFQIKITRNF